MKVSKILKILAKLKCFFFRNVSRLSKKQGMATIKPKNFKTKAQLPAIDQIGKN